eukprot:TRINITY_DN2976_c0_g1_i1.p1 TRINITY_DN2976_c0_g1~~TRINITY_DN2976_c0_g1_i1.p1  ORF type:complete len:208 (+),score=39.74 TRINITY_DN2976_c0_g1_i1:184-807(+)
MKLFKTKKAPTTTESLTRLKETLELLEKREAFLQAKCNKEVLEAKKFLKLKNKRAAMTCLKRKKIYEGQIDKLYGAQMTLTTQIGAIEGAEATMRTLEAMKIGASALEAIHKDVTLDKVDNIMDDIKDQMEVADSLSMAISQGIGEPIDEDELEAELDALEQESLNDKFSDLQYVKVPSKLPSTVNLKVTISDEDEELRALEASLAV